MLAAMLEERIEHRCAVADVRAVGRAADLDRCRHLRRIQKPLGRRSGMGLGTTALSLSGCTRARYWFGNKISHSELWAKNACSRYCSVHQKRSTKYLGYS